VNCDASYKQNAGEGGWGYVIRDSDGEVVIVGRGKIPSALDAFQTEVIACLQGVQATIEIGASRIVLETDAMLVKQAIDSNDYGLAPSGMLISKIQELARLNFVAFNVNVIPRTYNRVAHALAVLGCEVSEDDISVMDIIPPCIMPLVAADCATLEQWK
jgi:hypothetical protein